MELTEEVENALNEYLNAEFEAWYRYLALSAHFRRCGYEGFAGWCGRLAHREMNHGTAVSDYISCRAGMVHLKAIPAAENGWETPAVALKSAHLAEQQTSNLLHAFLDLVTTRRDYATRAFLEKCVEGQVDEEFRLRSLIQKVDLVGDKPQGLLLLDRGLRR